MYVLPGSWRPAGIEDMEPVAWDALRFEGSAVVVAGPGAGKTEFLAQRAAYLLQTGICPTPQRILAISFKTDAAKNLRSRVQSRVERRHARRLDSMTFDAFTKMLVDRFQLALGPPYRLEHGYDLWFPNRKDYRGYLSTLAAPPEWTFDVAAIQADRFEPEAVGGRRLGTAGMHPTDGESFAVNTWWAQAIPPDAEARLTFTQINRLAEFVVRTADPVKRAIWSTYPFVFIDECQDTTVAQFDFLTSLFSGSAARITAVGDGKQRIMGWAGALPDALGEVARAFDAQRFPLSMNYRSVPDLISLQTQVAWMLEEPIDAEARPAQPLPPGTDAAEVWLSKRITAEVTLVAADIAARLDANEGVRPNDCAVLVRQTPESFEGDLAAALQVHGIGVRNESERIGSTSLQDLLVEELTKYVVAVVRLVAGERNAGAWMHALQVLRRASAVGPEDEVAARRISDSFDLWLADRRTWATTHPLTAARAKELVEQSVALAGEQSLRTIVPSYQTGDAFAIASEALGLRIDQVVGGQTWGTLADAVAATGAVPLLTVHKSKGLEFHHVYFLGLDDRQWWAHEPGEAEGVSTFFVGLSRARQTARFCFCEERGARARVGEFLDALVGANVPVHEFD